MTSVLRILLVSVILAGAANAQAETTFPIANTSGREMSGSAAFDGTNFLVGIQGDATAGNNVTAQLVSKTGSLVGSRIATGASGGSPGVAFDGTNYLLVWECNDSVKTCITGQFVSTSGALVGAQFTIATGTDMDQGVHSVIFDGINYFVAWRNRSTAGNPDTADILGQFITTSGAKLGSVVSVSTAARGQREHSLAFDGTNILAVWVDGRNQSACYTDGSGSHCYESDIYGQFIAKSSAAAAGTLSGSNFLISAGTLPRENQITVGFDGTNYLVAFTEESALPNACPSGGCNWEAYGILVSKSGVPVGSKFVLGNPTTGTKVLPVPTYLGTKYLVAWTDGFGTTSASVKGQYVATSGAVDGSEFTLFSPASNGAVPWFGVVYTGGGANLAVTNSGIPDPTNPGSIDRYTSADVLGSLITLPGSDTSLPTAPAGLSATVISSTQIDLSWTASTDNVGVTQYKIYRTSLNNCPSGMLCAAVYYSPTFLTTLNGTPPAAAYSDTGLSAAVRYDYDVQACDAAGNCSARSNAVIATTSSAAPSAATLSLVSGWNLVGNSVQATIYVADYFNDAAKVASIWKWVTTGTTSGVAYPTWAYYSPGQSDRGLAYASGKGYELLTAINAGEGFWVHANTAFTAQLPTGTAVASTSFRSMSSGWHLISTGSTQSPGSFNSDMSSTQPAAGVVPLNIKSLWAWDSSQAKWYFYAPGLEAKGGSALADYISESGYLDFTAASKTLGSGIGFWVNMP